MKITPEDITSLNENEVFVFGSNYAGRHGKGAALFAARECGAENGQGTGLSGQSYGIATKDEKLRVLPLHKISPQVKRFLRFARDNPNLTFLVTPIGCGLAGYESSDIAPMFLEEEAPENVCLPRSFWECKERNIR